MKFGSLFSGIGGFDLGFEQAGLECAWQCEIDKAARSVLAKHWPGVPRYEDIRDVGRRNAPAVDLICGGFPCQDLSVAGKRAGLAGERSGLYWQMRRIVRELKPQWVVIENVPGLLSSNDGNDFAVVVRGLAKCGYRIVWRILDAQYFGVAQRRRRVFIVGSLGDGRSAEVLFEREGLFGHPPARRTPGQGVAGTIAAGAHPGGFNGRDVDAGNVMVAKPLGNHHQRQDLDNDTYIVDEPQTFDWQAGVASGKDRTEIMDPPGRTRSLSASRSLAVHSTGRGYWAEGDFSGSLRSESGDAPYSQALIFEPRYARNGRGAPDTIAPPLKAQNGGTGKGDGGTGKGDGAPVVAFTHSGYSNQPAWITGERTDAIAGQQHPSSHQGIGVIQSCGVRRLTPTECERLQGFPDGWTGDQSDSARYRQLGNAVAVSVARWIGERIIANA